MYSFGVPKWVIHSIHILVGLFLLNTGRNLQAGTPVPAMSRQIIAALGIVSALYQAFLWFRNGGRGAYSYGVPSWVVNLFHILNGLVLVSMSTNFVPRRFRLSPANRALYLMAVGGLAALYHAFLAGRALF